MYNCIWGHSQHKRWVIKERIRFRLVKDCNAFFCKVKQVDARRRSCYDFTSNRRDRFLPNIAVASNIRVKAIHF